MLLLNSLYFSRLYFAEFFFFYMYYENDGVPLPLLQVRIVQGLVRKGFLLLVLDCMKTKTQVERQNAITVHWKSSIQDYLSDSVVKSVVNRVDSAVI